MKAEARGKNPSISLQNPRLFSNSSASGGGLSSLDGACIEKLLLHCGSALECNDVTLAQQVMWVLNNVASSIGDPNQRLASYFLRALISRVSLDAPPAALRRRRPISVTDLAAYVDLIPWHSFGFCAANGAILRATQGFPTVHILDFSITHCVQWPTLIDALAKQPNGPPLLRISVVSWRPRVPPFLNVSIDEIGQRLSNFAKFREVPFEFNVIQLGAAEEDEDPSSSASLNYDLLLSQLNTLSIKLRADEGSASSALVVNCQNWLRYLPDEDITNSLDHTCYRDSFLELVRDLRPCMLTIVDEDCDLGSSTGLASRITSCFNYMWIPFDALETFLPKNSPQRMEYESDIGHKIDNIVGFEGFQRIERLESSTKLNNRMATAGFMSAPFCEETVREVKMLLDEHASGWGMKKDEDMLVLTWKGHNAVYATVWTPHAYPLFSE